MSDDERLARTDERLPRTGCSAAFEVQCSAVFVKSSSEDGGEEQYGTRTTSVVSVANSTNYADNEPLPHVSFYEKNHLTDSEVELLIPLQATEE